MVAHAATSSQYDEDMPGEPCVIQLIKPPIFVFVFFPTDVSVQTLTFHGM